MADEILHSLLKEYEQKKLKKEIASEKRKEDLYEKIPKLQQIENELNHFAILTAKNILFHQPSTSLADLEQKVEHLKQEKACILQDAMLPPNYLEPTYDCMICKDTGYVTRDHLKTQMCNCLKQKLLDASFSKSNLANLDKENFHTFCENLFCDEVDFAKYHFHISPRQNIKNIKQKAMDFVTNFDSPTVKNLLFTGNTGLRKNFYVKLYCSRTTKKRKNCSLSNSSCFA